MLVRVFLRVVTLMIAFVVFGQASGLFEAIAHDTCDDDGCDDGDDCGPVCQRCEPRVVVALVKLTPVEIERFEVPPPDPQEALSPELRAPFAPPPDDILHVPIAG